MGPNEIADRESRWPEYYRVTQDAPPRETLTRALDLFGAEGTNRERFAIDLGCGAGNDTAALLSQGWHVLAIDRELEAIDRVRARTSPEDLKRLECQVASFAEAQLPLCDLVNASFSLPFCRPEDFGAVWSNILASLRTGGRFAGQLFGDRDTWSAELRMTCHTVHEARALFDTFEIESWLEQEYDGTTALGDDKHWHRFSVVARKI
jgi:tellurite methyltransferase